MQLMTTDETLDVDDDDDVARGPIPSLLLLGQDDIKTSLYEGGLKSWECSLDLVTLLATEDEQSRLFSGPPTESIHVIEVSIPVIPHHATF